jgi:hypothetical protein
VSVLDAYAPTLESCEPFLVVSDTIRERLHSLSPMGVSIPKRNIFNPYDLESAPFLTLLQRFDELAYGPRGMVMPRWVFYDCAEMVGGLFGFGRRARHLPEWVQASLAVEQGYSGFVPLSLLILIPMLEPGAFLCTTLCSINQVSPGAAPAGLRVLTLALGLQVFPVRTLYATSQWRSPTLAVHSRFGPLEVLTAYTPAHSLPATVTFRLPVSEGRLRRALGHCELQLRRPRLVDADDEMGLRRLQEEIEAGARYRIVGAPLRRGGFTRVPVERLQPPRRRSRGRVA